MAGLIDVLTDARKYPKSSGTIKTIPCARLGCTIELADTEEDSSNRGIKHNGKVMGAIPFSLLWHGYDWEDVLIAAVIEMSHRVHPDFGGRKGGVVPQYPVYGTSLEPSIKCPRCGLIIEPK